MKKDYQAMLEAYRKSGGKPDVFKYPKSAHLIISQNKILGRQPIEGIFLDAKETDNGADVRLRVKKGVRVAYPAYLCFGVLPKKGRQEIKFNALVEKGAEITIFARCVFPNAVNIQHIMEAEIVLEDGASFRYDEIHYHGLTGGIEVAPRTKVKIGKGARLVTNFSLLKGRVGKLNIDYQAEADDNGILEIAAKAHGYGEDEIRIKESGKLFGEGARGLIKSRVAVREKASSEVVSELEASAPGAQGHIDCVEIVQGEAKAKAVPLISVLNGRARITHEAAVGKINRKKMETLMARGLKEEEASEIIIKGMLR